MNKSKPIVPRIKRDKTKYIEVEIPEEPEESQHREYIADKEMQRMECMNKLDEEMQKHLAEQEHLEYLKQQEPKVPEIPEEAGYTVPEEDDFIKDEFITDQRCYLKLKSGPTKYFVIDRHLKICEIVTITKGEKGEDGTIIEPRKEGARELQAHFCIGNLVIYPSIPELNNPEMYSFNVSTKDRTYRIGPSTLDEIVSELISRGLFYHSKRAMDITTNAINALKNNDQYKIENSSPYPGFFIINGKFTSTNEYHLPTTTQLAEALNLLNDFGEHYGSFGPKLGYICHWNIMAPFSFVIKQKGLGIKLNDLLLYGTTRTGKSTVAKLSSYFWGKDFKPQLYSGSMVHSVYQFGVAIAQSTYPIIVDEGENLYTKPDLANMLKSATHALKARARYNSTLQKQEEFNALSPVIITSNNAKPNDGALGARMDILEYTASDIRSNEEREAFDHRFKPEKDNGPLKILKFIGEYVGAKIIETPGILDENWLDASHKLMKEMYEYADVEMPVWMKEHASPEGVESSFEDEQNYILSNIKALILRNAQPVRYDTEIEAEIVPITNKMKVIDVVNQSREPWIYLFEPSRGTHHGRKFVYIEKGIETDLMKDKGLNVDLDRIAEILCGEVQRKNTPSGRRIKVAVFDYNEFIDQF